MHLKIFVKLLKDEYVFGAKIVVFDLREFPFIKNVFEGERHLKNVIHDFYKEVVRNVASVYSWFYLGNNI